MCLCVQGTEVEPSEGHCASEYLDLWFGDERRDRKREMEEATKKNKNSGNGGHEPEEKQKRGRQRRRGEVI